MKSGTSSTNGRTAFVENDLLALQLLQPVLPPLFPVTGYSMSPFGLLTLLNGIEMLRPANVLEIGSGMSTIAMANQAAIRGFSTRIFSIDHDAAWQEIIKKWLPEGHSVTFICAPLTTQEYKKTAFEWYQHSELATHLAAEKAFDFIVVDAPPSKKAMHRLGVVSLLEKYLTNATTVFIDDAHREQEKKIIDLICADFGMKNVALTNRMGILRRENPRFQFEPSLWHALSPETDFYR